MDKDQTELYDTFIGVEKQQATTLVTKPSESMSVADIIADADKAIASDSVRGGVSMPTTANEDAVEQVTVTSKDWNEFSIEQMEQVLAPFAKSGLISFNQIDNQIYDTATNLPLNDSQRHSVIRKIEHDLGGNRIPKMLREDVINTLAYMHTINPIEEFVKSLPAWDGVNRLDGWLCKSLQLPDNDYHRAAGALMALSIVLRAQDTHKYIKQDHMFVLSGPADLGKSSFVSALMPNRQLVDDTATLDTNTNNLMLLASTLVNEVAEISSIDGRSVNRVKAFISNSTLTFRVPYAHSNTTIPFHNTLIGTTNDPQILNDPTGNRKFIMLDVEEKVDTTWLKANITQIYAEALVRYEEWGRPYLRIQDLAQAMHLDEAEATATAVNQQNQHSMFHPIADLLHNIIAGTPDDALSGLGAKLDERVVRKDETGRVVAINVNRLRQFISDALIGQRTMQAADIEASLAKTNTYKIDAVKALTSSGFRDAKRAATQWKLDTQVRNWYYRD